MSEYPTTSTELPYGLSIVVPVYRSHDCLDMLVSSIYDAVHALNIPFELILVNDASPDDSWNKIQQLSQQYDWVKGLDMLRNNGQHAAVLAGVREAGFSLCVTMDDDLQHNPQDISQMLANLEPTFDVVYAYPQQQQHGFVRDFLSATYKRLICFGLNIPSMKQLSAYRLFRTHLRDGFATYNAPNPVFDALLTWSTKRFTFIYTEHRPRQFGKSGYTAWALIKHVFQVTTSFSVWPLHLGSLLGFVATLFGFGVLAYVVVCVLFFGRAVPGFAFLASVISIFAGVQLLCLGIIGEYLAGMYMRSFRKPAYTVRQRTVRR